MKEPEPARSRPRRLPGQPWLSAVILASWLLLQGSLAPAHWIWGAILALALPWLVRDFIGPPWRVRAPAAMLRLAAVVLWDIVRANLTVARLALHPRVRPRPAWVVVPYTLQEPRAVALLASIVTMTPGTVSCVVDEQRRRILVHALDAPDPAAVRTEILGRYERPLKEIFG